MAVFARVFHQVFTVEAAIAVGVFTVITLVLLVAVIRRRARRGLAPSNVAERPRVEAAYLSVLVCAVVFLVAFTAMRNHREMTPPGKVQQRVDVEAFQWCWAFSYPGTSVRLSGNCQGRTYPTLVVPVGRTVQLTLRSHDVIHSFWVPDLRYKRDVFPNYTNTITLRIDRAGEWIGRCAEYCGQLHYEMDFHLRAVPAAEFDTWLHSPAAAAGAAPA